MNYIPPNENELRVLRAFSEHKAIQNDTEWVRGFYSCLEKGWVIGTRLTPDGAQVLQEHEEKERQRTSAGKLPSANMCITQDGRTIPCVRGVPGCVSKHA